MGNGYSKGLKRLSRNTICFSKSKEMLTAFGMGANNGDTQPAAYLNYIQFDQNYKCFGCRLDGTAKNTNGITVREFRTKSLCGFQTWKGIYRSP